MRASKPSRNWRGRPILAAALTILVPALASGGVEPDPKTYWNVDDIRPGMKGVGRTVMRGTELEEFGAEVLGVMRDVSPGRDMVLCRLSGCNLEHAGIIQGMSGSPIYIDGKLLGAVAYAWEFAKDPIAGVTPFSQMAQYVRSGNKRIAAGQNLEAPGTAFQPADFGAIDRPLPALQTAAQGPLAASGGGLAGLTPIATPLAATGFTPRALAFLGDRLGPLGLAPMAGGSAQEAIIQREGDRRFEPGSPMSVAMVTGDFDLSAIGTVTHVEGDRVYGFGHPMFGLGACEFPLMTGYIHTVYPRASVSMKMGSPLKVVGVLDTDVSTAVAGRIGPKPDMLPATIRVKVGRYSEPRTYQVRIIREPNLLPTLVLTVLSNAIDTEGNLPDELTARIEATLAIKGREPIRFRDILSGPRYTGPMGPMNLFGPVSNIVNLLVRNAMEPVRIESLDCSIEIESGRKLAAIESARLASDQLEPGQTLRASVVLKPFKADRRTFELALPLPADLPEGTYEATLCDLSTSLRRQFRDQPHLLEPRDLDGILRAIRLQSEPTRTAVYLHVPMPERGLAILGQPLPQLPGSARAVFADSRTTPPTPIREEAVTSTDTPWVVEGSQTIRFKVVRDADLADRQPD